MRRFVTLVCSLAVVFGQAPVTMDQEPHHHLVFQNEALKIFQPLIQPGETTLEHMHTYDEVTVCLSGSTMRTHAPGADWSNPGRACTPGQASVSEYAGKPSSHTVQNAGSGTFRLFVVDNLRQSDWSKNPPVSGVATTLARETRSFQIFEVKLDRDSTSTTHVHSRPAVVVLLSGEVTDGKKQLREPGQWVLIPEGESHRISSERAAQLIEIELR
jgi:quercetin dioxygenase-like cupin family protein